MGWMIIRVRGTIHARRDISATLDQLHLTRPNHATIVPEEPAFKGMIVKVQGYVTWGEAEPETVDILLRERGRRPAANNEKIAPANAAAVIEGGLVRADGWKPLFRLKAPKGGWRSTKKPFTRGGALGYRGKAINELARRMV
jgi:large subunit ribosomal protein L30